MAFFFSKAKNPLQCLPIAGGLSKQKRGFLRPCESPIGKIERKKKQERVYCRNEDVSGRTTALVGSTRPPVLRRRRGGHRSSVRVMTSLAPLATTIALINPFMSHKGRGLTMTLLFPQEDQNKMHEDDIRENNLSRI
ncbi:hypothetical protein NPIL_636281 [Nephila pilipes]|uniref:Uncharacterized protein n=1 Tax=Nephila pilipes TaxID=299642 RepID=A0A8X6Q6N2_NEPPI|nr:hypothetical protein NPIL_636281 [Nephila pilipes]